MWANKCDIFLLCYLYLCHQMYRWWWLLMQREVLDTTLLFANNIQQFQTDTGQNNLLVVFLFFQETKSETTNQTKGDNCQSLLIKSLGSVIWVITQHHMTHKYHVNTGFHLEETPENWKTKLWGLYKYCNTPLKLQFFIEIEVKNKLFLFGLVVWNQNPDLARFSFMTNPTGRSCYMKVVKPSLSSKRHWAHQFDLFGSFQSELSS